jgi:hypothetical protein
MFNHPVFGLIPAPLPLLDADWDAPCALPNFRAASPDAHEPDVLGKPNAAVRQPDPRSQARADRRRAVEQARDVRALLAARAEAAAKRAEAAARAARAKAERAALALAQAEDLLATYE